MISACVLAEVFAQAPDLRLEASRLLAEGSSLEAAEKLYKYLETNPNSAEGNRLLGIALALIPRRAAAIATLERAVELDSQNVANHLALGQALARFGENRRARDAFAAALTLEPMLGQAHEGLALLLAIDGELIEAVHHFTTALASTRDDATAARLHYLRGKAHAQLEWPDLAATEFAAATRLDARLGAAYLEWGRILADGNEPDEAEAVLQRAAEELPESFEAQYLYGSQLLRARKSVEAVSALRRAVSLKPADRPAAYALGRALRSAGNVAEAREVLTAIAEASAGRAVSDSDINEAGRLNNLGLELEGRGDFEGALAKYEAAAALAPSYIDFQRNAGLVLCRLGRWREAKPWLRGVLRIAPGDVDATRALYVALEHAPEDQ